MQTGLVILVAVLLATAFALVNAKVMKVGSGKSYKKLPRDKQPVIESEVRAEEIFKFTEEATMNFTELVTANGYDTETHAVVTSDGYVLCVFRLRNVNVIENKGPVLLVHGLLDSADTWVITGMANGLGYILADAGYDVWLPNLRGNTYSRKHISLNPDKDMNFWDYSFNEIGTYDLPAVIDYVLDMTQSQTLSYIGHSMGTTSSYVLCSSRPEYNKKIKIMVSLAPVAFMMNSNSQLPKFLSRFSENIFFALHLAGKLELFAKHSFSREVVQFFCTSKFTRQNICMRAMNFLLGQHKDRVEDAMIPIIFSHFPNGMSAKTLAHYGQALKNDDFMNYNYGLIGNLRRYGTLTPPRYNLRAIQAPVVLICGANDFLSALKDTEVLRNRLPNVVEYQVLPDKNWSHIDYTWGKYVRSKLAPIVLKVLKKY